jgi:hypothetical protein
MIVAFESLMSSMRANRPILSLIVPLLGVASATLSLHATSNLIENSPFLPTNSAVGSAQQQSAPLELRSILKEGGEFEFSLYDAAKKQSTWAKLNEPGHDFTVKAFDPNKEMITVEQKSRTYQLALKESKITLMTINPAQQPAVAGMSPNGPQENGPPGGRPWGGPFPVGGIRGPVGTSPSLTPEQLHNLEADINRRRELRRQAAAPQSGGATSTPGVARPQ